MGTGRCLVHVLSHGNEYIAKVQTQVGTQNFIMIFVEVGKLRQSSGSVYGDATNREMGAQ